MKKIVYELSEKETKTYQEEFGKTDFAKKAIKQQFESLIAIIIGVVCLCVSLMIGFKSGETVTGIEETLSDISLIFLICGVAGIAYFTILLKICFYRWLKIKHNVEY